MNGSTLPDSPSRLWIIHFAFITAIPIYAFVMMLAVVPTVRATQGSIPSSRALLVYAAFAAISLIQIILGFTVPGWMRALADQPGDSAQAFINKRTIEMIVMDSLFESIAIYGLVGVFLGMQPWQGFSMMFVALIFLLIVVGRIRAWIDDYRLRLRLETHPA